MSKFTRKNIENLTYLVMWAIGYLLPILTSLLEVTSKGIAFSWTEVFRAWAVLTPFLAVFLIHNYLIAPFLFRKDLHGLYFILAACLIGAFIVLQATLKPPFGSRGFFRGRDIPALMDSRVPHSQQDFHPIPADNANVHPAPEGQRQPRPDAKNEPRLRRPENHPGGGPLGPMSPTALKVLLALAIIGINLAVKYYFKGQESDQKLADLEKQNLSQQLQYLRYQINPHFFMNTLNNIHALVDIDPEQAKSSILELQKLMRYVLYEGDKPTIPLEKETDFLSHYIQLMKLRYTDKVKIVFSMPENVSGIEIPPLLFVTFVENAFKHGVSYESDSFINISMRVKDDRLVFDCENSTQKSNPDPNSGIGIENVRKRLNLLYGEDYTFTIDTSSDIYKINLVVPVKAKNA